MVINVTIRKQLKIFFFFFFEILKLKTSVEKKKKEIFFYYRLKIGLKNLFSFLSFFFFLHVYILYIFIDLFTSSFFDSFLPIFFFSIHKT
jgi:hypothetical protein